MATRNHVYKVTAWSQDPSGARERRVFVARTRPTVDDNYELGHLSEIVERDIPLAERLAVGDIVDVSLTVKRVGEMSQSPILDPAIEPIINELRHLQHADGRSGREIDLARECGVPVSTFHEFMAGHYKTIGPVMWDALYRTFRSLRSDLEDYHRQRAMASASSNVHSDRGEAGTVPATRR